MLQYKCLSIHISMQHRDSRKLLQRVLINWYLHSIMRRLKTRLSETIIDKLFAKDILCKPTSSKLASGEVTEWFMVPLSKSGGQKCLVGSNPTLSAINRTKSAGGFRIGFIEFTYQHLGLLHYIHTAQRYQNQANIQTS